MTTTACDDQFAPEPVEPVRERYDTATILRRNIADLEIALKQQTERAEAAEAELEAVREDNHSMMLEIHNLRIERDALVAELARLRGQEPVAYVKYKQTGGNVGLSWVAIPTGAFYPNEGDPLFASPVAAVPAPIPFIPDDDTRRNDEAYAAQQAAPSVPEEWREVMTELADDLAIEIDQSYPPERRAYPSEQRRYEGEMAIVNRARAMLQSAEGCSSHSERGAP